MGDTRLTTPRPGTFTATLILFGPILVAACGNPGMVDSGTGAAPNVDARSADAAVETGLIDATAADALDATGVTGRDTAPTDTGSGDAGPSLVDAAPVTDTMPVADGGPPASAIYVSTTGDDRNVGTCALPVRSIARALAIRAPADEIRVLGGVYNAPVRVSVSGTATRRIRILAVDGARPVLDTMRVASARPLELAGSFIDVEGFEIRGGAAQCIDAAGSDLALRNLVVHDCVSHGIMIRGGVDFILSRSFFSHGNASQRDARS